MQSLFLSIAFFSVSSFFVHILMSPEDTLIGNIVYGIFSGTIFGVAFYFISRKTKFLDK